MSDTLSRLTIHICQHLQISPYKVLPESTFAGLGMDAFDILDLTLRCETEFGIVVPPGKFEECRSVHEARNLIDALIKEIPADLPPAHLREAVFLPPDVLLAEESARAKRRMSEAMAEDEGMRAAQPTNAGQLRNDLGLSPDDPLPIVAPNAIGEGKDDVS